MDLSIRQWLLVAKQMQVRDAAGLLKRLLRIGSNRGAEGRPLYSLRPGLGRKRP
jgi:hypothetical protein